MTLDMITSDILPAPHGFFGRRGGASSGIFEGLNCGLGSSDQREVVLINRSRVGEALKLDAGAIVGVHQVHSADVVVVEDLPRADAPLAKADALVCARSGIGLCVLTADCQPVLFCDFEAGVIGAAHAGWKGALAGVLEATVDRMCEIGATRSAIHATIGPSISQRNYQVGEEFLERFVAEDSEYARFFGNGRDGKYQFDLPALGLYRLREAGIAEARWTGHCTYADPSRFFSYRRATHAREADYGRQISLIRL